MPKQYPHYPIYLDVEGRTVVIVGGGGVAERKVETLLRHGARVTIVATEVSAGFDKWLGDERVSIRRKRYEATDLNGAFLVLAATDQTDVNERVAADSRRLRIPVNVADDPSLCDFTVPAVVERGSIQLAISTGGKSPALARRIRERIEDLVGEEYAVVNEILGHLRAPAQSALPTDADRKRFFEALLDSGILALLAEGNREEARRVVAETCTRHGLALPDQVRAALQFDRS